MEFNNNNINNNNINNNNINNINNNMNNIIQSLNLVLISQPLNQKDNNNNNNNNNNNYNNSNNKKYKINCVCPTYTVYGSVLVPPPEVVVRGYMGISKDLMVTASVDSNIISNSNDVKVEESDGLIRFQFGNMCFKRENEDDLRPFRIGFHVCLKGQSETYYSGYIQVFKHTSLLPGMDIVRLSHNGLCSPQEGKITAYGHFTSNEAFNVEYKPSDGIEKNEAPNIIPYSSLEKPSPSSFKISFLAPSEINEFFYFSTRCHNDRLKVGIPYNLSYKNSALKLQRFLEKNNKPDKESFNFFTCIVSDEFKKFESNLQLKPHLMDSLRDFQGNSLVMTNCYS
ncbi:hypothetical protein DICPUDRAFT_97766 [Dictyostelium purpureum]|uniref:Uncharacterized protein n=1 Tax=Dictyostelium purpureum TaxID=5786 RepID=F0ZJP1_DICPU|nr:uncharacterized protein DICPUDRAFT_97766 [Dictyostelium purpureum]EGC35848.1 hypothetical protein DICPUDRAFT_97766 [Dictyostelium purpureum]|eukprot:XP_003287637.1 hypothetical protein DICPUDRAFT_97766 [Dictyostelium purpureum]